MIEVEVCSCGSSIQNGSMSLLNVLVLVIYLVKVMHLCSLCLKGLEGTKSYNEKHDLVVRTTACDNGSV